MQQHAEASTAIVGGTGHSALPLAHSPLPLCLSPCLPAGRLREDDVKEWLANIRGAAPRHEAPLVELLSQVTALPA